MLYIRPHQMGALRRAALERFVRRTTDALRGSFPGVLGPLDDPAARAVVRRAVDRARGWGLRSERDIGGFVQLSLTHGEGFDDDAGAQAILGDSGLTPREKVQDLQGLLDED